MHDSAHELPAPAAPVSVLLEPEARVTFDIERRELLALALPDEIASPQEYSAVAADLERVVRFGKRVRPSFDEVCDNAHKAWKSTCNLRSMFFGALDRFEANARRLLGNYTQQQERIRRDEERRLAEEERRREEQRRNEEATLLKKQGQKAMAEAVLAQPVVAPAVNLPSAVPQVQGLSFRDNWRWRPVGGDTPQTRAAAVQLVPRQYLLLNDSALTALARSMKGQVKVPGIEFYNEKVPVQR